jgi:8-amino-7-oxononanoate synthase
MKPHTDAEKALAKFVYQEASLLFPSGWMANEAVIKTIPQKGDLLILDKLNHASIIDAAMASDAEFRTFRRDNTAKLEKLLANKNYNRKFIITESVFSMDGDCADLKTLVHLKNKYDAYLIVDEAHAFGCMGPNGAGLADELGLLNEVDIFIATLSKSFAAAGGIVAAPKPVIDYLVNRARPFIYTTAPSPVNAAVILASLGIIQSQPKLRQQLKANADYLRENLKRLGFDTSQSTTHIIPVIIGDEGKTLKIAKLLLDNGFYIPAIRPPTVPAGTSRLRISVQAGHSAEQLDKLISFLGSIKNIA